MPNETELALLVPDLDLTGAAVTLSRVTGAGRVVVTLAERGAHAWTADGDFSVLRLHVDAIDTVGAGDAFCGALAARLATGAAFEEAVRYANAAGALATTRPGAEPSMPRRDAVDALLAAPG